MTLSTDTIRTVIEIVPDWECRDIGPYLTDVVYPFYDGQRAFTLDCLPENKVLLDALAAAAARVVDAHKHASIIFDYEDEEVFEWGTAVFWDDEYILFRPDSDRTRTDNTIHIIAELAERL